MTTSQLRPAALLLLLAAACATGGGAHAPAERYKQADERLPGESAFGEDAERAAYKDVTEHKRRAMIASESGNADQARAEFAAAGEGLASMLDRFGVNEYQIPLRYNAAELLMQAQQWEKAAVQAERTATDPTANDKTKAMAYHLAYAATFDPGGDVLIEQPAYEVMMTAAQFLGANIRRFQRRYENGFAVDPREIERQLTPRTRLIVLCNLHNPSSPSRPLTYCSASLISGRASVNPTAWPFTPKRMAARNEKNISARSPKRRRLRRNGSGQPGFSA